MLCMLCSSCPMSYSCPIRMTILGLGSCDRTRRKFFFNVIEKVEMGHEFVEILTQGKAASHGSEEGLDCSSVTPGANLNSWKVGHIHRQPYS